MATEVRSRLGNTTHISVLDDEGACATVTCSNVSCSGVVVPGTGMHLNNKLGEQETGKDAVFLGDVAFDTEAAGFFAANDDRFAFH